MTARLMAIVAESERGRLHTSSTSRGAGSRANSATHLNCKTSMESPDEIVCADGTGAAAYADPVCIYLSLAVSKRSDYNGSLVQWSKARDQAAHVFGRQALPMVWDYAEVNPLAKAAGDFSVSLTGILRTLNVLGIAALGTAVMADAQTQTISKDRCIGTDHHTTTTSPMQIYPITSISGFDLHSRILPDLFATLPAPKVEELVAFAYRHNGKEKAEAMHRLAEQAHPAFPVTIYYAFKQSESNGDDSSASTGWETFLDAVIRAGFAIGGTWPMRTEKPGRMRENDSNALASSIILVCRPRAANAPMATRRDFRTALNAELPEALKNLQRSNIAPVDLAQAAFGPGMSVYTRYAKVLDADGKQLSVREALALINQGLDEVLEKQEGDFDADSRWALAWFADHGFDEGPFGDAHILCSLQHSRERSQERRNHRIWAGQSSSVQAQGIACALGSGYRTAPHGLGGRAPADPGTGRWW